MAVTGGAVLAVPGDSKAWTATVLRHARDSSAAEHRFLHVLKEAFA